MKEICFETEKPYSEIEAAFANTDFFSGLMEGLTEALAHKQGKSKAETFTRKRNLPQINVSSERKKLNMSQKSFADVLGVSVRTVEAGETGRSNPSPTARNLLFLISQDSSLIGKLQKRTDFH